MPREDASVRSKRTGAAIRRRRQALDLDQADLAERVGVHVNTVQKWESGIHYPGRKLGKLEQVLGISLDEEPEQDIMPPGLRERINEVLPPEAAARVAEAVEAALRGETVRRRRAGPG